MDWKDLPHNCTLATCTSTNDELKELVKSGAPHGTWISSLEQTHGRGRENRVWDTFHKSLALSILLKWEVSQPLLEKMGWIPILVGINLCREIKKTFGKELLLKWPNDLLIQEENSIKKVGGILCEGTKSGQTLQVICGIGINLGSSHHIKSQSHFDSPGLYPAGFLSLDREELLKLIVDEITSLVHDQFLFVPVEILEKEFFNFSWKKRGDLLEEARDQSLMGSEILRLTSLGELEVRGSSGIRKLHLEI